MTWQEFSFSDPSQLFTKLNTKLVLYKPDSSKWFYFPIKDTFEDWSKCLFSTSINPSDNEHLPLFFVHLQSSCEGSFYRSNTGLLDFLRYLRLSNYHPKSQSFSSYRVWEAPIVCFAFESRESILERYSEALVLFSPSVRFQRLPFIFGTWDNWLGGLKKLKPADENELSHYINFTTPVNLSSHHYLGNKIGPYAILNAIKPVVKQPIPFDIETSFNTRILHEIFWQSKQLNDSEEKILVTDVNVEDLKKELKVKQTTFLIIDDNLIEDKDTSWRILWANLIGQKTWARLNKGTLLAITQTANQGSYNEGFFNDIKKYSLIILDLRLDPSNDKNKQLEDITGYKVLKYIRKYDEAIPILVFTSSQRGTILQGIKATGADAVLVKPARFDTAPILVENLIKEIKHLLSPEYGLLCDIYYDLKKQENNSIGSKKAIPVQWALDAWREARHNVRNWIEHPEERISRLSAISVARTAGLAEEAINGTNKLYHPYKKIIFGFRNCASHFGITQNVPNNIGYLTIWFTTKLLCVLDNNLNIDTALSSTTINLLDHRELDINLPKSLTWEIIGAIQIGTLAFSINQKKVELKCEHLKEYINNLEETAKNFVINECKGKITINIGDLQQISIFGTTNFSHLKPWLEEIEKAINGIV